MLISILYSIFMSQSILTVLQILKKLKLTPQKPVEQVLKDKTRKSYSAVVYDQNKRKRFIKIRTSADLQQKQFFAQSYWLVLALKTYQSRLYYLTPKLLDGELGNSADFLLYEYSEGINMGSRTCHDVFKFRQEDLNKIIHIQRAICEIDRNLLPPQFLRRRSDFFRYLILEDVPFDATKLATVYSNQQIHQLRNLAEDKQLARLLNQSATTLQHGDFQAPNFIKTNAGRLIILDFDQSSLTNRFYDVAYFYNHAFRKPHLQKQLLQKMVDISALTAEEKILFYFNRLVTSFVWVKQHLAKQDWYRQQQVKDLAIRQHAFRLRVTDTKQLLNKLVSLG